MNSLTTKSIVILTFFASITLWVPSIGENSPPFNPTPEHDECSIYPREPECSEHEDICVWHSRRRRCGIKLFGKKPPKDSANPVNPPIDLPEFQVPVNTTINNSDSRATSQNPPSYQCSELREHSQCSEDTTCVWNSTSSSCGLKIYVEGTKESTTQENSGDEITVVSKSSAHPQILPHVVFLCFPFVTFRILFYGETSI